MFRRGEIYYIEKSMGITTTGSEQHSGRPAIIVSNDKNNEFSKVLEVVYLTTQKKTNLPTHVDIKSARQNSIALCEQVYSISTDRFGDYVGKCTEQEMLVIDAALAISLGLELDNPKKVEPKQEETKKDEETQDAIFVAKLATERDTYRMMYEKLLERVVVAQ